MSDSKSIDRKGSITPFDPEKLLKTLSKKDKTALAKILIKSIRIEKESVFSGPIPPPEDFQKYEEILPGSSDRILALPEKEQSIREQSQKTIFINDRLRIIGATLVGLSLVSVAAFAIWMEQPWTAIPFGLVGVITVTIRQLFDWLNRNK